MVLILWHPEPWLQARVAQWEVDWDVLWAQARLGQRSREWSYQVGVNLLLRQRVPGKPQPPLSLPRM